MNLVYQENNVFKENNVYQHDKLSLSVKKRSFT